jgi:arylsulfatase A-like enzyme
MGFLGLAVSVLPEVPPASGEPAAGRPNIVVIMTDDLDVHSLQVALALGLMPFLQQHVVEGSLQFRQAFVTNSLCCPSRATFLTGQYSHNNGVLSNSGPYGGIRRLKDDSTLATWLHDAGYRTGHAGKYLNGYGIDLTTGFVSGVPQHDPTYIPPGWDDWQALVDTTTYRVYGYTLNDNGQLVEPAAYQTDELASRAVDFIREGEASDETPFFLAVMPLAPHVEVDGKTSFDQWRDLWKWTIRPAPRHAGSVSTPLWPALKPSFNEPDVSDKPIWRPQLGAVDVAYLVRQYRDRLASLRAVDDLVGQIVGTLAAYQELDRTVTVFTSDNGFLYGEHRLSEKLVAYEESIRVPLYLRLPGARPSVPVDAIALNTDLAPTIAHLAGVVPGLPVDGRSLLALAGGNPPPGWRKRFLVEHWWTDSLFEIPSFGALRTGSADAVAPETLYVEYYDQNYPQMADGEPEPVVFRELYDLRQDPYQLQSLHSEPIRAGQVAALASVLTELRRCGSAAGGASPCQDVEGW